MYQRVNQHDFVEAFRTMGRYDRQDGQGGNFTYEALLALFDFLEEIGTDLRDDEHPGLELDVIALCCEFAEYDSIEELAGEYDNAPTVSEILADLRDLADSGDLADELRTDLIEWFRDQTTVIEIPGTDRIIIQSF